ncbi:MAG TPA: HAD-IIIC family phosphatase [Stellaceae bacterium]|jgi:FkbH-like protein|nr:HAD-IIIC family phosphatase [Stellaceae bacterium]
MSEPAITVPPVAVPTGEAAARAAAIATKRLWREHLARGDVEPALRIGIAASFTAETLVPFVGGTLVAEGFAAEFKVGPYNQLFQTCLAPETCFHGPCGAVVLLWRLEDLMLDEIAGFLAGDPVALARASDKLSSFAGAIRQLRANFAGMVVAGVPPYPAGINGDALALDNPGALGAFHRRLTAEFVDEIGRIDGVTLIDLDAVQRQVGLTASLDARKWYLYRQPFSDAFLHAAGKQLARIVLASRRAAKKCVVLDADNTLWGGIVGEDGIDGIQLGDEFPGSAYRDFQKLMLCLRARGVFLAVASKNNEADVFEVFDKHSGMVLRREHLSAWQINWRPKAEGIPLIAGSLNIGTDSLVFIDDNPMEIAYMRDARPEVTSILLPSDPADIVATIQALTLFDQLEVTDEDRKRADMMRAERDRESLGAQISHGDFLAALDLKVDLFRAKTEDLGRVTQLINKTNQYNLTTIRRTLDEVRALANSDDWRLYAFRVTDKFGEYGLTGVIIAQVSPDRRRWTLDSVLMSCRVLGRGVEAALIGGLAGDARAEGAVEFVGSYIPTAKNAICQSFLPDQGFTQVGDREWHLDLADAPAIPAHIERVGAIVNAFQPQLADVAE